MQRTDGSVKTDTRVYFNYAYDNAVDPDRILNRVVIASPGGNDTAIVFDDIPRHEQGDLSKLIQENYPGVEQVMYAEIEDGRVYGQMAGGEFC